MNKFSVIKNFMFSNTINYMYDYRDNTQQKITDCDSI